jgi:chorismate mutase
MDTASERRSRIESLRREIDVLDRECARLLAARARAAREIGVLKALQAASPRDFAREAEVLDNVVAESRAAGSPLGDEAVRAVWRAIMSACLDLERASRGDST